MTQKVAAIPTLFTGTYYCAILQYKAGQICYEM